MNTNRGEPGRNTHKKVRFARHACFAWRWYNACQFYTTKSIIYEKSYIVYRTKVPNKRVFDIYLTNINCFQMQYT